MLYLMSELTSTTATTMNEEYSGVRVCSSPANDSYFSSFRADRLPKRPQFLKGTPTSCYHLNSLCQSFLDICDGFAETFYS